MSARIVEVIFCDSERAGKGVEGDPIRVLQQFFTKDGRLICQYDPEDHVRTNCHGNRGSFFAQYPNISVEQP